MSKVTINDLTADDAGTQGYKQTLTIDASDARNLSVTVNREGKRLSWFLGSRRSFLNAVATSLGVAVYDPSSRKWYGSEEPT